MNCTYLAARRKREREREKERGRESGKIERKIDSKIDRNLCQWFLNFRCSIETGDNQAYFTRPRSWQSAESDFTLLPSYWLLSTLYTVHSTL
jgi:hypothetical protein